MRRLLACALLLADNVRSHARAECSGGFLFFARPAPAVTPHNVILTLREIADTMIAFRIESRTYQHAFSALLYFIGGYTLNQMLLRKELCRPQKAQEIMHNVLALVSWCHENGFSEAVLHLQSAQQACALLGLDLTSPLDVDEVTDRCFLLSSNQIHKLLSHFRTDDQDRGCHPHILEAIRRTAVGDTRSLLTDTVGGHARYTLPPAENVPAIDSYLPPTLQLDCLLRH